MPLSDDQRALLRLLAQREEGYDDIAALMGLNVDEVRRRVREALTELDGEQLPAGPVVGQGSSSSQAAGEEPSPTPPAEEAPKPTPVSRPAQSKPSRRVPPQMGRRRLWELAGGAVVVLLLILFVTGAIDIGGGDSDSDGSGDGAPSALTVGADNENLTQATLEPVDGGDASGRALFGRLGKEVVLQIVADGLEPTGSGESYTVWLYRSPKLALRVGAVKVGEEGQLGARFPVPAELLAFVSNGAFKQIYVSRTSDAEYKAEVAAAKQERRLPSYTGETVLTGEITGPIVSG
ncbi:MAG TPA: hypothetical protein VNP96_12580 [Solirubrobacterales bacterium]|nr:hypothetical protein [Solirubrobacterales bacterium]